MKEILELTPDGKVRVKEKKRSKYGNKRQLYDGMWFDSKAELRRWLDLKKLELAGKIRRLVRQTRWPIEVNDQLITTYVDDFSYQELHPPAGKRAYSFWRPVVEDVKGGTATQTAEFRIKQKLMKAVFDIDIRLTGRGVK